MKKTRFTESHAFVDIETLGLSTDCPILEASFVIFNLDGEPDYEALVENAISFPFNVQDQIHELKRLPDAGTMHWWMTQTSVDAQKTVLNRSLLNKADNNDVLRSIGHTLANIDHVWCRGPHFDAALLNSFTRDYGLPELWKYWKTRDIRTLLYTLDKEQYAKNFKTDMEKSGAFIRHDSAHDVAIDAYLVSSLLRPFLIKEFENDAKVQRRKAK
jgi:hypothetical protein